MSVVDVRDRTPRSGPVAAVRADLRLLRSELRLIAGRRRNQAGVLVLASVPVLIAAAIRWSQPGGDHEGGSTFFDAITSNGLFVALAALSVELALFLPLAVAALSGDAIAGEANIGTLRYLLTVPVGRTRLLAVKYASLVLGTAFGVLVVAATGVLVGGALFGLGPVTTLSGSQLSLAEGLARLGLVVVYLAIGLAALAAIGVFISTLTEQPIGAMIAVTVVSTVMWILDGIAQLDWLHPWLLVHHWPAFADAFRDPILLDRMVDGVALSLAYAVVFLGLAWARFNQKDVTS